MLGSTLLKDFPMQNYFFLSFSSKGRVYAVRVSVVIF